MKQRRNLAQTILSSADFPGEVLTGVPVLELKGSAEAVVLSHRGVIAYDTAVIRVATSIGALTVRGENMTIFQMNRERIVLHGKILQVGYGETI